MMKTIKRTLAVLLTLLMLMSFVPVVFATSKTADEAIEWVKSHEGKALNYDGVNGAQCVDLIMYYYKFLGVSSPGGNGKDYATNKLPSGWTRTKGGTPQKGDILVYSGSAGNKYGHVAIFESTKVLWHGRWSGTGKVQKTTNYRYDYDKFVNPYWGCIHPNFGGPDPTPPSPTPDITATWSNYSVKTISATNAEIRARVTFNKSVKHEKCGFYFGTQSGKLTKNAKFDTINKNRTYTDMWYDLNKFGQTLKAGTKYYYQFFIVANGKEYKSAEKTLLLPTPEPTPSITASWSKYNATNITETNAKIEARVTFNKSVKHEKCGFYFGTQSGKLTKNSKYDTINKNRTYTDMWYDLNKWYGKLTPGTTYYYQFFIVANGTEYKSAEQSFKTKGTPVTEYNFTVKYNANGGTGTMADQTAKGGQVLTMTQNQFKRAGYDFVGWNVKRGSDSKWFVSDQGWKTESEISKNKWAKKVYGNGITFTFDSSWSSGAKTTDTFTFYAVWKECEHVWNDGEITKAPTTKATGVKTYTCERCGKTKTEKIPKITAYVFKYAANGGKGTMSGTTVQTGETFVLPECEFTKGGASFGGWAVKRSSDSKWYTTEGTWETSKNIKANNLSKEVFDAGTEYELNEDWINGSKNTDTYTFYAVWIACEHEWDDGEVTKEPTTKATGVMTYTCELCGATKTEKIPKLASYQIKYAANGGKGTMTGTKVLKDDAITLSECEFTRAGYTFNGWMVKRTSDSKWLTEEDGWKTDKVIKAEELTKTVFDSDTEISLDEDWINGTKNVDTFTFYAVWVKE